MQSRTACAMHAPAGVWAMKCAARLGRLALRKGEGEGEGFFVQTHVLRSNPSPPAFGRRGDLRRGRQSSPLVQGERRERASPL